MIQVENNCSNQDAVSLLYNFNMIKKRKAQLFSIDKTS